MLRLLIIPTVLVLFCMTLVEHASAGIQDDDVLLIIPTTDCGRAVRVLPGEIHFYHRLGESYLAGTSRNGLVMLRKQHIDGIFWIPR